MGANVAPAKHTAQRLLNGHTLQIKHALLMRRTAKTAGCRGRSRGLGTCAARKRGGEWGILVVGGKMRGTQRLLRGPVGERVAGLGQKGRGHGHAAILVKGEHGGLHRHLANAGDARSVCSSSPRCCIARGLSKFARATLVHTHLHARVSTRTAQQTWAPPPPHPPPWARACVPATLSWAWSSCAGACYSARSATGVNGAWGTTCRACPSSPFAWRRGSFHLRWPYPG